MTARSRLPTASAPVLWDTTASTSRRSCSPRLDGPGADRARAEQRPALRVATAAQPRAWENPLRALIDAPAAQATGKPLAIELALHASGLAGQGAPRLMARLMREGARGGWVNGSLSWSGLDSWHVRSGEYRADHLALVRELYAVHRAREGRVAYSQLWRRQDA